MLLLDSIRRCEGVARLLQAKPGEMVDVKPSRNRVVPINVPGIVVFKLVAGELGLDEKGLTPMPTAYDIPPNVCFFILILCKEQKAMSTILPLAIPSIGLTPRSQKSWRPYPLSCTWRTNSNGSAWGKTQKSFRSAADKILRHVIVSAKHFKGWNSLMFWIQGKVWTLFSNLMNMRIWCIENHPVFLVCKSYQTSSIKICVHTWQSLIYALSNAETIHEWNTHYSRFKS